MTTDPLHVIVNADDFGMSVEATDAIVDCIDRGIVTSTTVMGNGPDMARALGLAAARPAASFGVHLNATQFAPLTSSAPLERLLTDGEFDADRRSALRSRTVRQALVGEFRAQVEAVQAAVDVSHLDSHHMVHWWPELLPVIKSVAASTGVTKVRTVERHVPVSRMTALKREAWRRAMSIRPRLLQTDEFQALSTFVDTADGLPASVETVELMVHPGHPKYAAETKVLESDWRSQLARPIRLITYHDL